ncbi:MAG: XcyI family restriction endonuclease [Verrucomicrobiales bacterium]
MQILFGAEIERARKLWLMDALLETVGNADITELDAELAKIAPPEARRLLATKGLRGELAFATPSILRANPRLLGYYRLLLGLSQKEFFGNGTGLSGFKSMETSGKLTMPAESRLDDLCASLAFSCARLVTSLNPDWISKAFLHDLTILTFGPQLRGGANNRRGQAAIGAVFELIREIVSGKSPEVGGTSIRVSNAAGRQVRIEFAADPDIVILEEMGGERVRKSLAIEIKGGSDISNIHNRLGEAEKSHRNAKQDGYSECWTVVNVDGFDPVFARQESPTTDHFFELLKLVSRSGDHYCHFRDQIASVIGI